ncbi:hypothetical protein D3C72_2581300 [compost metagenome]
MVPVSRSPFFSQTVSAKVAVEAAASAMQSKDLDNIKRLLRLWISKKAGHYPYDRQQSKD